MIKPNYFFLIPDLILNNKKTLKASSGFDAISQAVESMISVKSNKPSLVFAKKSLEFSLNNYLNFFSKPNLKNAKMMSLAAMYSGKAIDITKTTAPHAVSYPFTALYGISHGHAVSLTLEKFLKFNFFNINKSTCNFDLKKRYDSLFKIFKVKNIYELENKIKNLKYRTRLNDNFKDLNIDINNNYHKILDGVNLQRLKNNPIKLQRKDLKFLLLNNQ
jgi:alcohol dehydrogenase class IV